MRRILLICGLMCSAFVQAAVVTEAVEYRQGNTVLRGHLAYDDAGMERRPGVLVLPEWWGVNDYTRQRAEQLAEAGYLALVVDLYGAGRSTTDPRQAGAWAAKLRGTPLLRERARVGLEALRRHRLLDRSSVAAIGFCFGGGAALELAYDGAALAGVVSFHGNLPVPGAADLGRIKAPILVLHGGDDPFVKPEEIEAFVGGMRKARADWQMVIYGGAVHAFTNPDADAAKLPGVAYDERAEGRAWEQMQGFFAEIFDAR